MTTNKQAKTTKKAAGILSIGSRRSAYAIPVDKIAFQDGFNRRTIRERKETLKGQIKAAGKVLTAITGYYLEGTFYVNHGHGRIECLRELIAEGCEVDKMVPAEVEAAPKTDEDKARLLARQIIDNSGEDFKPIESARIIEELQTKYGWNNTRIGETLGFSGAYIGQLKALLKLPEDCQELVENGRITGTLANELQREHGDEAPEIIEKAVADAEQDGKKKATRKNVKKVQEPKATTKDTERKQSYKSLLEELYTSAKVMSSENGNITLSIPKEVYDQMVNRLEENS